MNEIKPQPGIMDIAPYKGGSSHVEGVDEIIKLSSNENPLGPSPAAKAAFRDAAESLHRYPSDDHAALREAIAEVHGLDPERIVCGAGSDEIIALLCQAYAGPGDDVIYTEHGFLMYRISSLAAGATPVAVPERERVADVDAILAACSDDTKLVFIANPNNPTGTMIGGNELTRLVEGLPPQTLLVLDGAYAEYVEGFDGGREFVETHDNVVMTRTFSKIYGLGALRVGWGYAPKDVVDVLNRVRGPFNVNAAGWLPQRPPSAIPSIPSIAEPRTNSGEPGWLPNWQSSGSRLIDHTGTSSLHALQTKMNRLPVTSSSKRAA